MAKIDNPMTIVQGSGSNYPWMATPSFGNCTIEPNRGIDEFVVDCSLSEGALDYYNNKAYIAFTKCFSYTRHKVGSPIKTITILGNCAPGECTSFFNTTYGGILNYLSRNVEEINMVNFDWSHCTSTREGFFNMVALKRINTIFSGATWNAYGGGYNQQNMFSNCNSLEDIRFAPNSIPFDGYHIFNVSQNFSDDTLVSIANGLQSTATQYNSLQLMSTPKARCSTLMGTVTDGIFTQDATGTTTLADFITNTKGWTLA